MSLPLSLCPSPTPQLFLTQGPPQVNPLPPQGPAPSEVLRLGVLSLGVAEPAGAEPGGAEFEVAGSGGAEPGGAELGGTEPTGAELEGTEPAGAESGGAEPRGTASSGGPAGASPRLSPRPEPLSPQQLREWFARRTRLRSGAAGARDSAAGGTRARGAGANRLGGVGVPAGAAGPGCACPRGTGAAGAGGAGGAGARDLGVGGSGAVDPGARDQSARSAGAVDPGAEGAGAGGATSGSTRAKGTVQWRPFFVPPPPSSLPPPDSVLRQVLGLSSSTSLPPSLLRPPPRQSQPQLQPNSPLPAPSPFAEQTDSFTHCREPESRPTSPIRAVHTGRRVPRPRPPPVRGTHIMALCPPSVPVRVPLPPPPESSLPAVPNPESDLARAARPTVTHLLPSVVTDPSFESTAASTLVAELVYFALPIVSTTPLVLLLTGVPHLVAMLLAPEVDPDAPDIPTTCSYAEAITGPYSSQWQTAMDAEMASWKSTDTYVSAVPPSRANIVDGMWIFRVKQLPGSPPVFKARYVARGFSQRQGVDFFQTFSPTPKMTTLQILHEEIWLRRPPGFTGSFPAHPSLFLCTDTLLALFYILVYVDDLVFATSDTEALSLVKSELQKRHICTDLGELRNYLGLQITRDKARRTITMTQSHMVHHVLQRFGFQHSSPQPTPLPTGYSGVAHILCQNVILLTTLLPFYVLVYVDELVFATADSEALALVKAGLQERHTCIDLVHRAWGSCFEDGVQCCEAEIYAWVIAAQELRWLTYLLTDLGEWLRSPPVLYVNLKAMIVLFREQRLEHRTKHIALRYFIARELQQRCQLRLSYVASRANTADVFTKALWSGDLQRFCTALVLLPVLLHMLVS
ncbi:unnamed protein product [Closterium sp. NIES-53]